MADQQEMGPGGDTPGQAQTESPAQEVKAILWVPDPEQRHGWREYYVYRQPQERKLGYREKRR